MAEATTTKGKEVAAKEDKLPMEAGVLDLLDQNLGAGVDDTDANDYRIPYVSIAQALTPQIDKDDESYIPGLEKGMIFDNVSGTFHDSIRFVMCRFDHAYIEWVPKNKGGGFVQRHELDSNIMAQTTRSDDNRDMLDNGNEIIDTRYLYVLILDDDGNHSPAVISFARTGTKPVKTLLSRWRNLRIDHPKKGRIEAPMFFHIWTMGTATDQNKEGLKYHVWTIEPGQPEQITDAGLLRAAIELREAIGRGERGVVEDDASDTNKDEPAF
jgi:hypothetical protein